MSKITMLNMMDRVKRLKKIRHETFVAPVSWVHGWFSLAGPNGKSVDVFEAPAGHSMETDYVDMYLVEGDAGMMVEFESKITVRRRILISELEESGVVEMHLND